MLSVKNGNVSLERKRNFKSTQRYQQRNCSKEKIAVLHLFRSAKLCLTMMSQMITTTSVGGGLSITYFERLSVCFTVYRYYQDFFGRKRLSKFVARGATKETFTSCAVRN